MNALAQFLATLIGSTLGGLVMLWILGRRYRAVLELIEKRLDTTSQLLDLLEQASKRIASLEQAEIEMKKVIMIHGLKLGLFPPQKPPEPPRPN